MATHSSILAWKIPWTEEPQELQFMGHERIGQDLEVKMTTTSVNYGHTYTRLGDSTLVLRQLGRVSPSTGSGRVR